ncbi:MAG: hypothetical protein ACKO6J_09190 [Crocinitomicaceae bacterium]
MRPIFKIVLIVILLALTLGILYFSVTRNSSSSVNDSMQAEGEFDYYQFKSFDLKKFDINATILLPDETAGIGTTFTPEMLHEEGSHLWQLQLGRNFIIHIEDLGQLTDVYSDFRTSMLKSTAFTITPLVDTDSLLVYSRALSKQYQKEEQETFHLFAVKFIDGRSYQFRNREEGNTKEEILFMQKSIESIK